MRELELDVLGLVLVFWRLMLAGNGAHEGTNVVLGVKDEVDDDDEKDEVELKELLEDVVVETIELLEDVVRGGGVEEDEEEVVELEGVIWVADELLLGTLVEPLLAVCWAELLDCVPAGGVDDVELILDEDGLGVDVVGLEVTVVPKVKLDGLAVERKLELRLVEEPLLLWF